MVLSCLVVTLHTLSKVFNGVRDSGEIVPYDGVHDGILNRDDKILFTHEFLQGYWNQSTNGRISGKGYFRSVVRQWKKDLSAFEGVSFVAS